MNTKKVVKGWTRTLSLGPTQVKFSHISPNLSDINLDHIDKNAKRFRDTNLHVCLVALVA